MQYWEDRLLRAKALGLNTIQTYVPWNLHEPKQGEIAFEGIADIISYLKLCQKLDLLVMLRVGPYICGGKVFCSWLTLLQIWNCKLRCSIPTLSCGLWPNRLDYLPEGVCYHPVELLVRTSEWEQGEWGGCRGIEQDRYFISTTKFHMPTQIIKIGQYIKQIMWNEKECNIGCIASSTFGIFLLKWEYHGLNYWPSVRVKITSVGV